jgi:hypothetical protein
MDGREPCLFVRIGDAGHNSPEQTLAASICIGNMPHQAQKNHTCSLCMHSHGTDSLKDCNLITSQLNDSLPDLLRVNPTNHHALNIDMGGRQGCACDKEYAGGISRGWTFSNIYTPQMNPAQYQEQQT